MAAVGSQVSVRMAGSRPAFLARRAMEPASRRATYAEKTGWGRWVWGLLFCRARVSRSGGVSVGLRGWGARGAVLGSGPGGWVRGDMAWSFPWGGGWAGRGSGRGLPAGGGPGPRGQGRRPAVLVLAAGVAGARAPVLPLPLLVAGAGGWVVRRRWWSRSRPSWW